VESTAAPSTSGLICPGYAYCTLSVQEIKLGIRGVINHVRYTSAYTTFTHHTRAKQRRYTPLQIGHHVAELPDSSFVRSSPENFEYSIKSSSACSVRDRLKSLDLLIAKKFTKTQLQISSALSHFLSVAFKIGMGFAFLFTKMKVRVQI
jgi:hypothetical protein